MSQVSDLGQFDFNKLVQGATNLVQGASTMLQSGVDVTKNPLAAAVKSVTFYTNYSPEKTYTGQQLDEIYKDPTPNPYLALIKPTIVLDTAFGKKVLAPYGRAEVGIWKANVAQAAIMAASVSLLVGVGIFVWGRSVGRKGG